MTSLAGGGRRSPVPSGPAAARQAAVLGALALYIVLVYLAVPVALGTVLGQRSSTVLSLAATALVALTFARVRHAADRMADRLFPDSRGTPYEVLMELSDRMACLVATEDLLPQVARIVAEGSGAAGARVWLRRGDQLVPTSAWPNVPAADTVPVALAGDGRAAPALPSLPGGDHVVAVSHGEELIGAISVAQLRGRPLSPADLQLVGDIAAQAGLVLRNVRLDAELADSLKEICAQAQELRASRKGIVATQDAERRQVERDIHDGAQQYLVALMVHLGLARTLATRDPAKALEMVGGIRPLVGGALATLHDLALGIHPPLLRQHGLARALAALVATPGTEVAVEADDLHRYSAEMEAAVYFACLEAVQNACKHAAGSRVVITLRERQNALSFSVSDDGAGFEPERCRSGSGLANMVDRLAALGGSLQVRSAPGAGTEVLGRVPVPEQARARARQAPPVGAGAG